MPAGKKVIKRKPGNDSSKNYFTMETQENIVLYQQEPEIKLKNKIYIDNILPAFDALVQNLINVYRYHIDFETKEDLKNECLEFLLGVVGKFDNSKGTKAFSYFNVVAKNWLTIKSKQNVKNIQMFSSLDDKDQFSAHEMEIIENYHIIDSPDEAMLKDLQKNSTSDILVEMKKVLFDQDEKDCLEAIVILYSNIEDVNIINRRAMNIYLKEITKLNSKKLALALAGLKEKYKYVKNYKLNQ